MDLRDLIKMTSESSAKEKCEISNALHEVLIKRLQGGSMEELKEPMRKFKQQFEKVCLIFSTEN